MGTRRRLLFAACAIALAPPLAVPAASEAAGAAGEAKAVAKRDRGDARALAARGNCPSKAGEKPRQTRRRCKAKAKRRRLILLRKRNARQKRPNVIVVMTDDQNDTMEGLPLTERLLAEQGTRFRNSYVSFPLCCPSRATFLTGQYSHNHGVFSTSLPNGYNGLDHANTLPVWLRRSGYRTAMVGKYLNGYGISDGIPERVGDAREIPPGWAEWYALTGGFDQRRYFYKLNEQGKVRRYKGGPRNYVTDVLARKAVDFIKRQARYPKPIFLWFNPTAPHGEAGNPPIATRDPQPAPRHLGRYEFAKAPRTPNFNEADVSDKPASIAATPPLDASEVADLDRRQRGRMESMLAVDDAVKRIVGRLRKARDLRKTYIFFTSDNGLLLGSHRLRFKNHIYEESTRVPLIVRGPKFPPGTVRDQPVSNVDLAPTIAALAKARPTLTMDGRSLVPVARDASFAAGREILFESTVYGGSAGVRSGRWVWLDNGPFETPELYDLASDPFQLNSLHQSPVHESVRGLLASKLALYRDCSGPSCP